MTDDSILVLANGDWGNTARLADLVDRADRVIAADGAWAKAIDAGIPVDVVVGDLDSLTSRQRASLFDSGVEVRVHSPEKDFSDLELAVDDALAMHARKLVVFGAFGGRIDHTMANVLLLEKAVGRGVEVELIVGDETAWLTQGEFTLPAGRPGDRMSLIPLSDIVVVRTDGLRYRPENDRLVRASAHGVSNEIEDLPVRIVVRTGTLLVVHGPPPEPLEVAR